MTDLIIICNKKGRIEQIILCPLEKSTHQQRLDIIGELQDSWTHYYLMHKNFISSGMTMTGDLYDVKLVLANIQNWNDVKFSGEQHATV